MVWVVGVGSSGANGFAPAADTASSRSNWPCECSGLVSWAILKEASNTGREGYDEAIGIGEYLVETREEMAYSYTSHRSSTNVIVREAPKNRYWH